MDAQVQRVTVIDEVAAERRRQHDAEGFTPDHDDRHDTGEIALAAMCYVDQCVGRSWLCANGAGEAAYQTDPPPSGWPWGRNWWKPKSPRRDLIRACALLIAEIERLDRVKK